MRVVNGDGMDTNSTENVITMTDGTGLVVPDGYLTVPEAAERTGLSQRAIRRAITENRIPAMQYLGRWAVRADDLDAYSRVARRHRTKGASAPTVIGTLDSLPEMIEKALQPVLDRAVEAEAKLRVIEASTSAVEIERDQLRERVVDLEAQLSARRKSWWPWSRDRGSQTAA
jgi:excisionase family DNA binding protein